MTTEYGQRMLIDTTSDQSALSSSSDDETDSVALLGEIEKTFGFQYGATGYEQHHNITERNVNTIRFQVIVWNIGTLDVAVGSVPMTFRISLYWNDVPVASGGGGQAAAIRNETLKRVNKKNSISYTLQGRTKALPNRAVGRTDSKLSDLSSDFEKLNEEQDLDAIDIPPVSILNVSTFTIIGTPEVDLLDSAPDTRLMRWTCMYRATVMQDHLNVRQFPHDCHNIGLELAILTHRRAGQRWDRRFWRLGLATEEDVRVSRKALRVPYGLVVDHVRIPEFHFQRNNQPNHNNNSPGGLQFQFCTQQDGSFDRRSSFCAISDVYLRVSLMVLRESGYYDRNIVPLLAFLNVVAATLTLVLDPSKFFYRGLLILNIAFNQIGIRLSVDKMLPSVGYEIRLQKILNEFFFGLLALILEAALVYFLATNEIVATHSLQWVDALAALTALGHNAYRVATYYASRTQAHQKYNQGILDEAGMSSRGMSARYPHIV